MDQWIQLQKDDLMRWKRLYDNQTLNAILMLGAYNHFKILLLISKEISLNSKEHLKALSSLNWSKLMSKLFLLWAFPWSIYIVLVTTQWKTTFIDDFEQP